MTDEVKIVAAALAASVFTVGFTEPVRSWLQRRRIRRWLYREMIYNCQELSVWVHSASQNPEMQEHTAVNFSARYRKLAYEMAVKDAGFYSLRGEEPYRIDGIYREFDRISTGSYGDPHDCFIRAETASSAVVFAVRDRALSRRVVFSVSTRRQKRYLRERLPRRFFYVNYDDAPRWLEILRFRSDAVLFWFWRRRAALFPSRKG
jgi:hypothetical protein